MLHPPKQHFNGEYGILFLKQDIACGHRMQQKANWHTKVYN